MEELIEYLENKIVQAKELGGMEREIWAFTQAIKKAKDLQLQQGGVMARFNISEDELIKELEDKRICKLSDLPEDIYYLHRKETARWLLEKYNVFKK